MDGCVLHKNRKNICEHLCSVQIQTTYISAHTHTHTHTTHTHTHTHTHTNMFVPYCGQMIVCFQQIQIRRHSCFAQWTVCVLFKHKHVNSCAGFSILHWVGNQIPTRPGAGHSSGVRLKGSVRRLKLSVLSTSHIHYSHTQRHGTTASSRSTFANPVEVCIVDPVIFQVLTPVFPRSIPIFYGIDSTVRGGTELPPKFTATTKRLYCQTILHPHPSPVQH